MTNDSNIKVFAAVVGGLGFPQTGVIAGAIDRLDGVRVWTPERGYDNFRADVDLAVRLQPAKKVVLIGHSFGAQRVLESCRNMFLYKIRVDYLAMLDPVCYIPLWARTLVFPKDYESPRVCDIFRASNSFPVIPANITGGPKPIVIDGSCHNSLCQFPTVIDAIVSRVAELVKEAV